MALAGTLNAAHRPKQCKAFVLGAEGLCLYAPDEPNAWVACAHAADLRERR